MRRTFRWPAWLWSSPRAKAARRRLARKALLRVEAFDPAVHCLVDLPAVAVTPSAIPSTLGAAGEATEEMPAVPPRSRAGLWRRNRWVGSKHVFKRTQREAYHYPATGCIPLRQLTLWGLCWRPDYDKMVESGRLYLIMEAGLTAFGLPLLIALLSIPLFFLLTFASLAVSHYGVALFLLGLLGVVLAFGWLRFKYVLWWSDYYVVERSALRHWSGWFRSINEPIQESGITSAVPHFRGRWFTRWFWEQIRIGDIVLKDAAGQEIDRIPNVCDPQSLSELLHSLITSTETKTHETADATRRAAELAEKSARHAAMAASQSAFQSWLAERQALGVRCTQDEIDARKRELGLPV